MPAVILTEQCIQSNHLPAVLLTEQFIQSNHLPAVLLTEQFIQRVFFILDFNISREEAVLGSIGRLFVVLRDRKLYHNRVLRRVWGTLRLRLSPDLSVLAGE